MKNKLNQPDVETTITTFNSATGESITINKTIPSKQFEDIFVTGISVEDQQAIVDFKRNHAELNLREYGHIKIEPDVITYNGKIYTAIDSQPTLEECIKEWEEDGFAFYKGKNHIHFRIYDELSSIDDEYIFHPTKKYYVANDTLVTFKRFQLISKTIKALEANNA